MRRNLVAYSEQDPISRHNAAAMAWLDAVRESLVETPKTPRFISMCHVLPNETEIPIVGDGRPLRIYVNFVGKGAEIYDFAGYFQAVLPGTRFVEGTVMKHDFTKHRKVAVPRMWIEVDPNEPTPKERRFSVHRDLGLPLTNGEFFWFVLSILGLLAMTAVLYRHWSGYHQPWKGAFDQVSAFLQRLSLPSTSPR